MNPRLQTNTRATREERRRQLEELYRAGLIKEFTLVPGGAGDRATWDVERLDGQHFSLTSGEVPAFVAGVAAGVVALRLINNIEADIPGPE